MVIHAEYRRVVAPEPLRSEAGAAEWGWKFTESEFLGEAAASREVAAIQARLDASIAAQRETVEQQLAELGAGARF